MEGEGGGTFHIFCASLFLGPMCLNLRVPAFYAISAPTPVANNLCLLPFLVCVLPKLAHLCLPLSGGFRVPLPCPWVASFCLYLLSWLLVSCPLPAADLLPVPVQDSGHETVSSCRCRFLSILQGGQLLPGIRTVAGMGTCEAFPQGQTGVASGVRGGPGRRQA